MMKCRPLLDEAARGRAAYIEAEIFGGAGRSACVLAESGRCDVPRVDVDAFNIALRFLGVRAEAGKDEFDTVRLGRYRSTGEWLRRDE